LWDGTPLDGRRVLVRCYHGLGDTIQFVRYASIIRDRVRELTFWAQPALLPLLSSLSAIDRLLPLHEGHLDSAGAVDVESMELPYVCRTTLESVPAAVPYLHAPAVALDRSRGPAVGLVWRAGEWAAHRSLPFRLLEPIVSQPATWYVLQAGAGLTERPPTFGTLAGTHNLSEAASVIGSLDLLITIDSMAAHLAGALAAPVWLLLPADADWRWMTGRDDSPWYPTMRIFRQPQAGDWGPVVSRVAACLREWIEGPAAAGHAAGGVRPPRGASHGKWKQSSLGLFRRHGLGELRRQTRVQGTGGEQRVVGTLRDDAPAVEHENAIGGTDRR
jgi:hypothetical protein